MADLTSPTRTRTSTPTPTTTPTTTTPETDTETPPTKPTDHQHFHPHSKILSFTNGAIKNHHPKFQPELVVVYKECLKNHAASLGGHALDGCGEFMPSPCSTAINPTSLKCAACGCHRNFHRREPDEGTHVIEYPQPHNNHNPVPHHPPPVRERSPNSSVSPPPISSAYYPSAPHILLALSAGLSGPPDHHNHHHHRTVNNNNNNNTTTTPGLVGSINSNGGRKRFRTKFSQEQKDKMHTFSERLGWKMQKRDGSLIEEFCNEVGVGKSVLKVWMHNNKNTFGKRDLNNNNYNNPNNNSMSSINLHNNISTSPINNNNHQNGSSSSS